MGFFTNEATTRRASLRFFRGLWRRLGTLPARTLGRGVLSFDIRRHAVAPGAWPLACVPCAAGKRHPSSNAGSNGVAETFAQRQFGLC